MNNRASNKILSLALAAVMALGMFASGLADTTAYAVEMGTPDDFQNITLGTGSADKSDVTVFAFGGKEWYAIGYNGDGVYSTAGDNTVTLLLRSGEENSSPAGYGETIYNSTASNHYSGSNLQTAMNNAFDGSINSREQALVIPRDFIGNAIYADGSDNVAGADVGGACFWPLSVSEANIVSQSVRKYADTQTGWAIFSWWLRSPGSIASIAACVYGDGGVLDIGLNVRTISFAIRPAFKLNLSSVIFTSAAAGGKSVTAGDTLSAAEPPTDAVKLTVLDSANLSLTSVTPQSVNGRTITFDYTATAGKTLSAIVKDSGGEVKYYGKLAENITGTESVSATVPDDFATGDTLQIFVEEINADYDTDFASTPATLNFSAQSAPTGLVGVRCTTSANNNGKITGTTMAMEYSADNGQNWIVCTATETTDLAQGSYHVRYAGKTDGTTTYLASDSVQVTVGGFTNTSSGGGGGSVSTYTVTFDSKEGSAVSKYTGVTYGNTIKIPADPTKSGYTFAGWYKDDITFNTPWDFTTDKVTSNITLYAKWTSDSSPVPVLNGWVKAGDDYYYYKDGVKVTSSWITTKAGNKYYVGANGKMAKSKWITTKYGNKYYVQASGRMARSKWITTKAGNKYYVQANGRMARSKWITTKYGNQYYVDANGRMTKKK